VPEELQGLSAFEAPTPDRMSTVELKRRKSKRLQSKGLQSTDASHTRPNVNSDKGQAGSTRTNGSHDQPRPRQGSIIWCCSMALVLLAALAVGTSKLGVLDRQSAVNLPSATSECYAVALKLLRCHIEYKTHHVASHFACSCLLYNVHVKV
jgi:hypothetical protein